VVKRRALLFVLAASLVVGVCGLWVRLSVAHFSPQGLWARVVRMLSAADDVHLNRDVFAFPNFPRDAGLLASRGLILAAGTLALISAMLWSLRYSRRMAVLLVALAVVEVFTFARRMRETFDLTELKVPELENLYVQRPADERMLSSEKNLGILMRRGDIWGDEPGAVRRRYAEFMAFAQGDDPSTVPEYVDLENKDHPLFSMLRLGSIVERTGAVTRVLTGEGYLPHLQLVTHCLVGDRRDEIFTAMSEPSFDPTRCVILEKQPDPTPVPLPVSGSARILNSSTDHLTIEANIENPAILLVTDSYDSGWRARALPGSAQTRYEVMPANYVLRAVPLSAGHHRFRMEYAPRAFLIGAWISILSLVVYLALVVLLCARCVLRYHSVVPKHSPNAIADANDDHEREPSG
jgi:hypothetical protein